MKEIKCKNCVYFMRAETTISSEFIDVNTDEDNGWLPPVEYTSDSGIVECTHKNSYRIEEETTPVNGTMDVKIRIAGSAQFNRDNDCVLYKPTIISRIVEMSERIIKILKKYISNILTK